MIFVLRCVFVVCLVVVAIPSPASAQEAIFVVRHAERVDGSSDAALSVEAAEDCASRHSGRRESADSESSNG